MKEPLSMAFFQMRHRLSRVLHRQYCSGNIRRSVFVSQSHDIFVNLALEDWLYKNFDFTNHYILMLWRNEPCVVIGRHQNPWLEANVPNLGNVQLARRNSGGGTVYHDRGNLNLTFFTTKAGYDRKQNLELVCRGIFEKYALRVDISPRQDLMLHNCKISGTAAKYGRTAAYHHCTLLVDVNKSDLRRVLNTEHNENAIKTNATRSIKSKIMNLSEERPEITVDGLLTAVGSEFLRSTPNFLQNGFQLVRPEEEWFPGLTEIYENLRSWEWCYGKTPSFSMQKSFACPSRDPIGQSDSKNKLEVTMMVEEGRIKDVTLTMPPGTANFELSQESKTIDDLKGQKFSEDAINSLGEYHKDKFITDCVRQVLISVL